VYGGGTALGESYVMLNGEFNVKLWMGWGR